MPTILLPWLLLLASVISITNAAMCYSTDVEDCLGNPNLFCMVNCSQVAVLRFNQPPSHGNCGLFYEVGGSTSRHACYVNDCPFTECIATTMESASTIDCCCTEDFCNDEFATAPPPSATPSPPAVNVTHLYFDDFPHHTNNTGMPMCLYVVCVCVCACVHACVHSFISVCMHACVSVCICSDLVSTGEAAHLAITLMGTWCLLGKQMLTVLVSHSGTSSDL